MHPWIVFFLQLRKHFFFQFNSNRLLFLFIRIGSLILTWFTQIWLTQKMGVAQYGLYAYTLSWLGFAVGFTTLGFEKVLVSKLAVYTRQGEFGLMKGILKDAFMKSALVSFAFTLCTHYFFELELFEINRQTQWCLRIAFAGLPFFALSILRQYALLGMGFQLASQIFLLWVRPLLFIIFLLIFYQWSPIDPISTVLWLSISYAMGYLLQELYFHIQKPKEIKHVSPVYDHKLWMSSAMLMLLFRSIDSLDSQLDMFFLGYYVDHYQLGLYGIASKLGSFVSMPMLLFELLLLAEVAEAFALGTLAQLEKKLKHFTYTVLFMATLIVGVFWVFHDAILTVFGKEFVAAAAYLKWVCVGEWFNVSFGAVVTVLLMTGHEKQAIYSIAFATLVNALLSIVSIPVFGVYGAIFAKAISYLVWNILMLYFVRKKLKIRISLWGL